MNEYLVKYKISIKNVKLLAVMSQLGVNGLSIYESSGIYEAESAKKATEMLEKDFDELFVGEKEELKDDVLISVTDIKKI